MDKTLITNHCNLNKVDFTMSSQTNQLTLSNLSEIKNNNQDIKDESPEEFTFLEFIENVVPNVGTELIYVLIQLIELVKDK